MAAAAQIFPVFHPPYTLSVTFATVFQELRSVNTAAQCIFFIEPGEGTMRFPETRQGGCFAITF